MRPSAILWCRSHHLRQQHRLIIPGVHKANGLRQLQKLWGANDSEVVVFGDGGGDIEMLRQAGFSFAMENAGNAVVAAAKYRSELQ